MRFQCDNLLKTKQHDRVDDQLVYLKDLSGERHLIAVMSVAFFHFIFDRK